MHRGYIKLWRKIEDSGILGDPSLLSVWVYILMNATHKKRKTKFAGRWVELEPGQLITGRNKIAKSTNLTPTVIRRCLRDLSTKGLNAITTVTTNYGTFITVSNWGIYQINGSGVNQQIDQHTNQQTTSKQPANNQQTTTIQECKNDKNDKNTEEDAPLKRKIKNFSPPTVEDVNNYAREKGLIIDSEKFCDYFISVGWTVGKSGKKMKDWKAAVRNWIRRGREFSAEKSGNRLFERSADELNYPKPEEIFNE